VELVHTIKMESSKTELTHIARVILLHGMRMWPQMVDQMFWPFAINAAAERMNSLHIDTDSHTPESKFYSVNIENILVKTFHTMFCPCYALDSRLHNAASIGPPKWGLRSNICDLGHSPFHTRSVALVYNPSPAHVSPQYHVVFDDDFATVPYMEAGMIPPHWSDLVHFSSESAGKHALNLAQTWLGSTGQDNTDIQFADDPVIDPFTIVTDCHTSNITKNTHLDQAPNITYQKQPSMTVVLPQTEMAVSKGGTLTLGSKHPLITAADSVPPAS
jgi:hypothetical protein